MKLHTTDRVSLGFGLFFLGVAGFWLIAEATDMGSAALAWSVVCGLVTCGLLGLAAVAAAVRRRRTDDHHT